ncbi:F-box only protein 16 [Xyrichtys novacula]|nr:F-box only protein 16 [Xyrichtys novacula]
MVCSVDQLMFLSNSVSRRLPLQAADFTCLLPRVLCLYLFSFLDPRSLCRCAQVSWHWKGIVELDQLWMPKCVRLGWYINFSPTPFEQGVWKRHYILAVKELRLSSLQVWRSVSSQQQFTPAHVPDVSRRHDGLSESASAGTQHPGFGSKCLRGTSRKKQPAAPPPWRGSDRSPKDTLRFNYLDNTDSTGPAVQEKMKIRPSSSWKPADVSKRSISETNYKLRKAKSLMFLSSNSRSQQAPLPPPPPPPPHETESRPSWAARSLDHPATKETTKSSLSLTRWNAGIRPGPVRTPVPKLSVAALRASQRSHRSVPSDPLFQTWTLSKSLKQDTR